MKTHQEDPLDHIYNVQTLGRALLGALSSAEISRSGVDLCMREVQACEICRDLYFRLRQSLAELGLVDPRARHL